MSNLQVDLTNKEIQDIQAAVYTMLERIKARVDNRGIFQIARIVPGGSLAEKTILWKYSSRFSLPYNEYLE